MEDVFASGSKLTMMTNAFAIILNPKIFFPNVFPFECKLEKQNVLIATDN
jgi:hypothetical protein